MGPEETIALILGIKDAGLVIEKLCMRIAELQGHSRAIPISTENGGHLAH